MGQSEKVPMRFFKIFNDCPWEGCGRELASGVPAGSPTRKDGLFRLARTGPYMPPITVRYGNVMLSDAFRKRLEAAFPECSFRPVIKEKIVKLDWQDWSYDDGRLFPGPDYEHYIKAGEHSPEAAAEIGEIWELVFADGAESYVVEKQRSNDTDLYILLATWSGANFFSTSPAGSPIPIVSEKAKQWIEHNAAGWLGFKEVKVDVESISVANSPRALAEEERRRRDREAMNLVGNTCLSVWCFSNANVLLVRERAGEVSFAKWSSANPMVS